MICLEIILAFWITLPQWHLDHADRAGRIELYTPVAASICRVARNDTERAWLATQAYAETKLARYVLEERCQDGPPGERCDAGRAIGPWQAHKANPTARYQYCTEAWTAPTRAERYDAGARCALLVARTCRTPEGWFAAQSGRGRCKASWARKRVRMMWRMLAQIKGKGSQ
jgi:hypothetical protein